MGLNKEQEQAVNKTEGPVLIIAGAGSGKTTTLINRTAHIIDMGVAPENILMLTFTNKAANEMKERGKIMLDDRFDKITAGTYHSFCALLLRQYGGFLSSLNNNYIILDTTDSTDAIDLVMSRIDGTKQRGFPRAPKLTSIFSAMRNRGETLEDTILGQWPDYESFVDKFQEIFDSYMTYKRENNKVDYDDLIELTIELLEGNSFIRGKVSEKYKYIMVDEYQDSNAQQLKLLKLLCDNKKSPNICAVGDDQQSIYLFRGAQFSNIINYPKHFEGCEIIILNKNYRSTQEILDISNSIIADAKEKYDKNLVAVRPNGDRPYLVRTASEVGTADWIAEKIAELHNEGVPYSEIAVLSRTSRATNFLEARLRANGVGFQKFGGLKFMDRRFVKDIFAFLKILIDIHDEIAWFRVLQLFPGVGPVTAQKMFSAIDTACATSALDEKRFHNGRNKYGQYLDELRDNYNTISKMEFSEMFDKVCEYYFQIRQYAIDAMIAGEVATEQGIGESEDDLETDQKDCEEILKLLASKYRSASAFISEIALEAIAPPAEDGVVTISTIHSIKGLEYKAVFIYNCVEGQFPLLFNDPARAKTPAAKRYALKEAEEERRILYVAATRAKDYLYVMFPQEIRTGYLAGNTSLNRFLLTAYENDMFEDIDADDYY